jgi:tetratricopeptide (TPR) repeat protein
MVIARVKKVRVEDYSKEKIQEAMQKCEEANQCVLRATRVTKNRDLLIEAVDLYQEAINMYSRIPDPYIGIAYISYVTGEVRDAIGFINLALSIDPKNPKALQMLKYYQKEFSA